MKPLTEDTIPFLVDFNFNRLFDDPPAVAENPLNSNL